MSKALNKKSESRKHAYALVFELGYHEELDVQKELDYYFSMFVQEYIDENLSDVYRTTNFSDDVSGLKTTAQYIVENVNKEYVYEVFSGTYQNLDEIDTYIEKFAKGWKIERLNKGVLAVLRLAIYEMKFMESIPLKVSVQEAINLTNEYCGEDTVKFVNGILGSVIKDLEN